MIASAGPYPSFFENLPRLGLIMTCLLLIQLGTVVFGCFRLWRKPTLTFPSVFVIGAPCLVGCLLATCQSLVAQHIASMDNGLVFIGRPDRYIGRLRIYLAIGIAMSAVLLFVAFLSSRRLPPPADPLK